MTSHSLGDTLQPPRRAVWRWHEGPVQMSVGQFREHLMPLTQVPGVCRAQMGS